MALMVSAQTQYTFLLLIFMWCPSFLILPPLFSDVWQNSQFVKRLTAVRIIYSQHIHRAFHFLQLSPRTLYEFSITRNPRGWGKNEKKNHPTTFRFSQSLDLLDRKQRCLWGTPFYHAVSCILYFSPFPMLWISPLAVQVKIRQRPPPEPQI